jgi:hypothetical protein
MNSTILDNISKTSNTIDDGKHSAKKFPKKPMKFFKFEFENTLHVTVGLVRCLSENTVIFHCTPDYRPLRAIYSYPVSMPLQSHRRMHETDVY